MRFLRSAGLALALLLPGANAAASPFDPIVDFRDRSLFSRLDHARSGTVTVHGYTMTIQALEVDSDGDLFSQGSLYWSGRDGVGIRGSGRENDEVEWPEVLKVGFAQPIDIERFLITDLYVEWAAEVGAYSVDAGASWTSFVADGRYGNGEVEVLVNRRIDSILFTAPGKHMPRGHHELSVAGFDPRYQGDGNAPEPGAALLFALGLTLVSRSRLGGRASLATGP